MADLVSSAAQICSAGLGQIDHQHLEKLDPEVGMLIIKIGGPAYRIGMGGGAASSVASGSNKAELDFNAVQVLPFIGLLHDVAHDQTSLNTFLQRNMFSPYQTNLRLYIILDSNNIQDFQKTFLWYTICPC